MKGGCFMPNISLCPSIVLDAICFLEKRVMRNKEWMNSEQIKTIEYINSLLPDGFENRVLGMSNLSFIISAYTDNNLEFLTLDEMISIFENADLIEKTVKNRIPDGFTASYTYSMLECLKDGWNKKYIEKINVLKRIGYENIYAERVLPLVKSEIDAKQIEINKVDHDQLFNNISLLKKTEIQNDVKIFVSFFSYPTAFALYNGSFLTCFTDNGKTDFVSIIAHELMHGFASNELTELYRKYVNDNDFLSQCHNMLINEFHSGDEEEFVMAAEYFLCLKTGLYNKSELMKYAKARYSGCCPVAAIIFDLLEKENDVPRDYNQWLINIFKQNVLPLRNAKDYVDAL
jgi:DNA-binding ferritin-like protein (Dps family)